MPVIKVVKSFLLPSPEAGLLHYGVGEFEVDEATAEHWYVRAHLEGYVEPPPKPGGLGYAQAALDAEQAVRRDLPMATMTQPRPPLPPGTIEVASRSGMVPEGAHYFAGQPQVDKPMPGHDEVRVNFLTASPS
jgi:hypothetical protein